MQIRSLSSLEQGRQMLLLFRVANPLIKTAARVLPVAAATLTSAFLLRLVTQKPSEQGVQLPNSYQAHMDQCTSSQALMEKLCKSEEQRWQAFEQQLPDEIKANRELIAEQTRQLEKIRESSIVCSRELDLMSFGFGRCLETLDFCNSRTHHLPDCQIHTHLCNQELTALTKTASDLVKEKEKSIEDLKTCSERNNGLEKQFNKARQGFLLASGFMNCEEQLEEQNPNMLLTEAIDICNQEIEDLITAYSSQE